MKVRVQFYPDVRKTPPYGLTYRPHFVVKGTELYLGIQFDSLQEMPLGTLISCCAPMKRLAGFQSLYLMQK